MTKMEVCKPVGFTGFDGNSRGKINDSKNDFLMKNSTSFCTSKSSKKSLPDSLGGANSSGVTNRKITALLEKIPALNEQYIIHHKVGEGTFSSVYLGTLRNPSNADSEDTKIAIKHLVPTCSPARIVQEVYCLKFIGGTDNVVGLKHCLRKDDNCVFIMPYLPHRKFSEYVMDMDVEEAKLYLKNLLIALRRVHSFKIIHRDVKPTNFLYDRENKKFLLVDFGLAEEVGKGKGAVLQESNKNNAAVNPPEPTNKRKRCHTTDENENGMLNNEGVGQLLKKRPALHQLMNVANIKETPPVLKKVKNESPTSLKRHQGPPVLLPYDACPLTRPMTGQPHSSTKTDVKGLPLTSKTNKVNNDCLSPKRQPLSTNTLNIQNNNVSPNKYLNDNKREKKLSAEKGGTTISVSSKFIPRKLNLNENSPKTVFQSLVPSRNEVKPSGTSFVRVQNSQVQPVFQHPSSCVTPKRVSQCRCDSKPQVCNLCLVRRKQCAPRAGTPGFRPPEVLLKYPMQTTAVDIWSVGVIFLSILSGCYPFFRSPDDISALAEIMSLFGSAPMKQLATKFGKNIICSSEREPMNLKHLCERLRRRKQEAAELSRTTTALSECSTCDQFIYPVDGCLCKPGDRKHDTASTLSDKIKIFPDSAYDLLLKLLDLDADTRITAVDALKHPFLIG